jgi:hypothetical protein
VAKIYKYKLDNTWHGDFEWSDLLQLPDNTLVWYVGLCPDNHPPERCEHCLTIGEIKKKRAPKSVSEPTKIVALTKLQLFVISLLLLAGVALYPYVCTQKNTQEKKIEIIDQTIKLDITKLRAELRTIKTTEYYETQKISNPELIKDKKGDYFIIDLGKVYTKEKVLFKPGRYIIEDLDEAFLTAVNHFMKEVYTKIDKGVECQLFVKGSADIAGNKRFQETLDATYGAKEGFARIEYLKSLEASQSLFSQETGTMNIGGIYTNKELPNLRGKFIQYKIMQNFKEVIPKILEGKVEGTVDEKLRNAYLLLYVNWQNKKYAN